MKRRQTGGGGWESRGIFSVRCLPGLNESTCFLGGGCDKAWGMDLLGETQLSSRDYSKEVCIVSFKLYLIGCHSKCCRINELKSRMFVWNRYSASLHITRSAATAVDYSSLPVVFTTVLTRAKNVLKPRRSPNALLRRSCHIHTYVIFTLIVKRHKTVKKKRSVITDHTSSKPFPTPAKAVMMHTLVKESLKTLRH